LCVFVRRFTGTTSIAVQNFNEQACILALGAGCSLSTAMGLSSFGAITAFALWWGSYG
jgi:hypothetical protein